MKLKDRPPDEKEKELNKLDENSEPARLARQRQEFSGPSEDVIYYRYLMEAFEALTE